MCLIISYFHNSWWMYCKLESSQSPHISAKAMLFARRQHHLRFCSGFPYAPLKAMVTKISKWSRMQDSFRITPKIESLVDCAIPDIPSKFQKDPSITFWVILLTHRQTNKVWQKHYLLGGGNNWTHCMVRYYDTISVLDPTTCWSLKISQETTALCKILRGIQTNLNQAWVTLWKRSLKQ